MKGGSGMCWPETLEYYSSWSLVKTHWRPILEWLVPSFNLKPELGARGKDAREIILMLPVLRYRDSTTTSYIQMTSKMDAMELQRQTKSSPGLLLAKHLIYWYWCGTSVHISIICSEGSQSAWEGASVLSALHPPASWEFMLPTPVCICGTFPQPSEFSC